MIKQRIVGAMVLVALSVIFFPMIFTGKEAPSKRFQSQIPPKPEEIETMLLSPEDEHELSDTNDVNDASLALAKELKPIETSSRTSEPSFQETSTSHERATPEEKAKKTNKEEVAAKEPITGWALQVATFSDKKNAQKLVDRLKKSRFKAFLSSQNDEEKYFYIVFVGPHLKKSVVKQWQPEIDQQSGSQSLIVKFNPIKH